MKVSKIVVFIFLLVFASGVISTQKALDRYRTPESSLEESIYLPDGKILKIVSLGFSSLVADFLWLKSVLYFGKFTLDEDNPYVEILLKKKGISPAPDSHHHHGDDHEEHFDLKLGTDNNPDMKAGEEMNFARDPHLVALHTFESKGMAPYIYPLLRRVVELNPYFTYPYLFGGLVVLDRTGEIDDAYSLLQFGWKHNPHDWKIAYYLGFIDLLYRGDNKSALRWLSHAIMIPGHLKFIDQLYQDLLQRKNNRSVVIDYLKGIYQSTDDTKTREQIIKMIGKISQPGG